MMEPNVCILNHLESDMGNADYDPERFGKVQATLEAQNAVLTDMRSDINRIFGMIYAMQNNSTTGQSDWLKLIVAALLGGAVSYFIK